MKKIVLNLGAMSFLMNCGLNAMMEDPKFLQMFAGCGSQEDVLELINHNEKVREELALFMFNRIRKEFVKKGLAKEEEMIESQESQWAVEEESMTELQENLDRLLEYQEYGQSLNRIISFGQKDEGCKIDDIIKCLTEEQDEKVKQSDRFQYCIAFVLLNKEKIRSFISPTTNLQPLEDQYPRPLDLMKSSAETYIPSSDFLEYWESEIGQLEESIDE